MDVDNDVSDSRNIAGHMLKRRILTLVALTLALVGCQSVTKHGSK